MRNTKNKVIYKSYFGNIFETPYLHRDLSFTRANIGETLKFLSEIDISKRDNNVTHPYFRNIDSDLVVDLLKKLSIHPANDNVFDLNQIIPFIEKEKDKLKRFDVLVLGGSGGKNGDRYFTFPALNIKVKRVARTFDVHNKGPEDIIRISGVRAHLWGRFDTKFGLTQDQISFVEERSSSTKAQSYLDLTGSNFGPRNPLLIIYFVDLDIDEEDFNKLSRDEQCRIMSCNIELNSRDNDYNYVVGYAIGFPSIEGADTSAESYTVNVTANYFDNEHGFEGDDENE